MAPPEVKALLQEAFDQISLTGPSPEQDEQLKRFVSYAIETRRSFTFPKKFIRTYARLRREVRSNGAKKVAAFLNEHRRECDAGTLSEFMRAFNDAPDLRVKGADAQVLAEMLLPVAEEVIERGLLTPTKAITKRVRDAMVALLASDASTRSRAITILKEARNSDAVITNIEALKDLNEEERVRLCAWFNDWLPRHAGSWGQSLKDKISSRCRDALQGDWLGGQSRPIIEAAYHAVTGKPFEAKPAKARNSSTKKPRKR